MTPGPLVVVGDCLRDIDVHGRADRLCPDAVAPVLDAGERRERAGGAGLTAVLASHGERPVVLVTALGTDDAAVRALLAPDVEVRAIPATGTTPTKTRMLADGRVLLRVDDGGLGPVAADADRDRAALDAIAAAGVVLVSDYGRGVAADPVVRAALTEAAGRVPVVWDPHPRGAAPVPGVAVVTPNLAETRGFSGLAVDDWPRAAADAAEELRVRWGVDAVAVTGGSRGALLRGAAGTSVVPAVPAAGGDPCGAGDRFAATVAARLGAGDAADEAVAAAVAAAAEFVAGGGAGAHVRDLLRPGEQEHARTTDEVLAAARARGGRVVATGGCFDLVHAGHARTLSAARDLAGPEGVLVVCLNSDVSVRRLKGPARPVVAQDERAELLAALTAVDAVEIFDEDDPRAVLARLRPDVWVKGGDYATDDLAETPLVRGWGGEVVTVPYHPGRSSTRLLAHLEPPVPSTPGAPS